MPPLLIDVYGNDELLGDERLLVAIRRIAAEVLTHRTPGGTEVVFDSDADIHLFPHVISVGDGSHLTVDLFVRIEVTDRPDDHIANRQERGNTIRARIAAILLDEKVVVRLETVSASWSS